MFRQFQFDNTAFPSTRRANSFVERVATHHTMSRLHSSHDVVDTSDAFGAFGAFDTSFDDDMELRLFEYLYDVGSRQSNDVDESADLSATNNDNTKRSHNSPSDLTSRTLAPNVLPDSRPFNSPVESCYWSNLGLASPARVPSPRTAVEDHDERASSSSSVTEPEPFLIRSDLALGELQVAENPFSVLPLPSMDGPQGDVERNEEKVVSDEGVHLFPSPLTVSNSSESTRADSPPFPRTPSVEPCAASGTAPPHVEAAGLSARAPASPNGLSEADFPPDKKKSLTECVSDDALFEVEEGPDEVLADAGAEVVTRELTADTSSLTPESTVAHPEEVASAPKQEPADLELAPEAPFPSSSQSVDVQEPHAFPVSQDTHPSKKRKRVAKSHAVHELRALSTLPPERKIFSLPVRAGRASKTGINKVRNLRLESESCCHLAGNDGFCQFRDLADGSRKCLAELPKDDKAARAHFAVHTDALGWREYSRRHPDWKPTCPWCNEPRTKFEQLIRHILDTHLLMFMEWCPCGGTNSRSNHKPNTVRHIYSDVHKAYLRQQAELKVVKIEGADEVQQEFVQGSSKGNKRRRRG
ncbi:hypothetical protein ACEPAH_7795 [Sanghuangporus vaninii]